MSDAVVRAIIHGAAWGALIGVLAWGLRWLVEESRRWRRLIQLYMEKQLNAPLPVDTDEDEDVGSSLHLPAEELEELEREDEEEEELRKQRLT